jgi:hypothetical protein
MRNENMIIDLNTKIKYEICVKFIFVTCCEKELFSPNDNIILENKNI